MRANMNGLSTSKPDARLLKPLTTDNVRALGKMMLRQENDTQIARSILLKTTTHLEHALSTKWLDSFLVPNSHSPYHNF